MIIKEICRKPFKFQKTFSNFVPVYFFGNNWQRRIEKIGKSTSYDPTDTLII